MHDTDAKGPGAPVHSWANWRGAVLLTALLLTARFAYLLWLCPYDLAEDEAFYWDWSRHVDWSYYSKGPGIAWALWLSTHTLGMSDLGVRAVAVLAGALASLAVAGLTLDVTRGSRRAALLAVALFALAPGFQATALISTIDGPYIAGWALAAWGGYRALHRRGAWAWVGLGAGVAAGLLFKYAALLLVPGVVLAVIVGRRALALHGRWRTGLAAALALALLGLVPIVVWNAQNDWGTLRHLLGAVGLPGGDRPPAAAGPAPAWSYNPKWTLEMLGAQAAFIGPMLVVMAMAAFARRDARETPGARAFLLSLAAPILVFYFALTFVSGGEGNWALAGYVTLIPLAAAYLDRGLAPRGAARAWWRAILVVGIVTGLGMLRLDLIQGALARVWPGAARAIPLHRIDGARDLARGVQVERQRLAGATGQEPFIITSHYGVASQLGFYLPDRPVVRTAMSRLGGRTVQQDFWPDASLDDPALLGRPAILLGASAARWARAFQRVEPLPGQAPESSRIEGDPRADRRAFIGYGYRGFR